ncbi:hypothetical protein C5C18_09715 [Rathayibacter tritici]|uniref:AMP-binding protein n=1 Tax=Rathayibacter tritici TaxID=33888 RepID=UPI000CE875E6|nr:AMP-binding protein [Rathayibacter tritici]PPF66080.1 hypothetical protein C5C21_09995 [Rathayibacter tritici]PPG06649.1 hypothetical protein C5C18_09715 [Rathayibacter tritici]
MSVIATPSAPGTAHVGSKGTSGLAARILEHAQRAPHAPAVVMGLETTTYAELVALARAVVRPIGGEDRIAVLAHKTPRTIAFMLGALLSGRSVLVLAPTMPEDRSAAVIAATGTRVLVDPRIGGDIEMQLPSIPNASGRREAASGPNARLLLTTSGTTGVPKVVPLPPDSLDRFIDWASTEFGIGASSSVLNLAPLNFDLTLLEVWATLATGGCAVLIPPERAVRGAYVLDVIEKHRIDLVQAVPTFFRLMLESAAVGNRQLPAVTTLIVTGDRVDTTIVAGMRAMFPNARILNVYGMTETNDSFVYEVTGDEPDGEALPIGSPVRGVHARVLANDGTLDEYGVGELLVSTPFQACCYLDSTVSAERFVPLAALEPTAAAEADRIFVRTGDLVDRQPGRPTRLLGRVDRRVKIRGLAVDLSEVERILETHPYVAAAAAIAEPDPIAGHRLAVVVQRAYPGELDLLDLRSFAGMHLARGSTPSEFHVIDYAFPHTITGKIDRPGALAAARDDLERH